MVLTLIAVQSVSADQLMSSTPVLAVSLLVNCLIFGLVLGLLLKLVGSASTGFPITFASAVLTVFVSALVSSAVMYALAEGGVIDANASIIGDNLMSQLMPAGLVVFVLDCLFFFIAFAIAAAILLKGAHEERPNWFQIFLLGIVTTIALMIVKMLLIRLGVGVGALS